MDERIRQAIYRRHFLQLDYNGSTRIVEPHIYGVDTRGNEALSAYQVAGGSLSGESAGWKMFDLAKVGDIQMLAAHFSKPRPEYNPGDSLFREVYSQL